MNFYEERVGAGLRRMKIKPDAFLFCGEGEYTWDKKTIFEIPVFHTPFVQNTMSSEEIDFIPLWNEESGDDYIIPRKRFNDGYEEA